MHGLGFELRSRALTELALLGTPDGRAPRRPSRRYETAQSSHHCVEVRVTQERGEDFSDPLRAELFLGVQVELCARYRGTYTYIMFITLMKYSVI